MATSSAAVQQRIESKPVKRMGRFSKIALSTVVAVTLCLTAAHLIWKYSGSGQWQLEIARDGIKIYTMKTPGSPLKDYKLVRRVRASMNQIAAAMRDTSLKHCSDWNAACVAARPIQDWVNGVSYTYYRLDLPFPFRPRDLVFRQQISQDPKTKVLTVDMLTVSGFAPEYSCCVRVPRIHNVWQWTPLGNGEVELQLTGKSDHGLPYVLTNMRGPQLFDLMERVPRLIALDEYRNQKVPSIEELPSQVGASQEAPRQEQ